MARRWDLSDRVRRELTHPQQFNRSAMDLERERLRDPHVRDAGVDPVSEQEWSSIVDRNEAARRR